MSVAPNIISDGNLDPSSMSGAIWAGQSGLGQSGFPFEKSGEPNTRHVIQQQLYSGGVVGGRKFRAYESLDRGITWAEMDAGNGPVFPSNQPATSGAVGLGCATAQDFTGKKLYLVYWNTAYFLTIIPFDQTLKKFGVPVVSTIIVTPPLTDGGTPLGGAAFRPSDGSIWYAYEIGPASGTPVSQLVKFAGGTLVASTFVVDPLVLVNGQSVAGLSLNPVDNTIVGAIMNPAQTAMRSYVVHTDDSISTPVTMTGTTGFPNGANFDGPQVDANGQVSFILFRGSSTRSKVQVIRWQSADAPASFISELLTVDALASFFKRVVVGPTGTTSIFFVELSTFNFVYIQSAGIGSAWGADKPLGLDINTIADERQLPAFMSQIGTYASAMGYQPIGEGGQGYLETDFTPSAPPVNPPNKIAQAQIVPFPAMNPCCGCPKQVGCVECGPDGKMYAVTKTMLVKG